MGWYCTRQHLHLPAEPLLQLDLVNTLTNSHPPFGATSRSPIPSYSPWQHAQDDGSHEAIAIGIVVLDPEDMFSGGGGWRGGGGHASPTRAPDLRIISSGFGRLPAAPACHWGATEGSANTRSSRAFGGGLRCVTRNFFGKTHQKTVRGVASVAHEPDDAIIWPVACRRYYKRETMGVQSERGRRQ